MAKKTVTQEVEAYTVTAPFDEGGKHYEPGDEFIVPAHWTRDTTHEEVINQKGGERICFTQPEIEENKDAKIAYVPGRRILLPISEPATAKE